METIVVKEDSEGEIVLTVPMRNGNRQVRTDYDRQCNRVLTVPMRNGNSEVIIVTQDHLPADSSIRLTGFLSSVNRS